jgi:hypothetical protein
MARKDTLVYPIAAAQSLSASFITPATAIRYTDNVSYQIVITTTNSTGTFNVQVSDDYVPPSETANANPGNWVTLTLQGGTPTVASANDDIMISLNQLPFTGIRLQYVSGTAGTGIAKIVLTAKQIGG